jgi:hypothetical protein
MSRLVGPFWPFHPSAGLRLGHRLDGDNERRRTETSYLELYPRGSVLSMGRSESPNEEGDTRHEPYRVRDPKGQKQREIELKIDTRWNRSSVDHVESG